MPAYNQDEFIPAALSLPYDSLLSDVVETKAKGLRKMPVVECFKEKIQEDTSRCGSSSLHSMASMTSSSGLKVAFSTPPPPKAFKAIQESAALPGFADVRKVPSRFL